MLSQIHTEYLYVTVYIVTTIFGFLSQIKKKGQFRFRGKWLFFSFLVHWTILSFTDIGSDYWQYAYNIETTNITMLLDVSEIGFNGLCLLLHSIFKSPDIVIFIIKTIEISILYYAFYRIRLKVRLGLSIFAYNALIFLQALNLLSMHMAIVLLLLSFVYLLEGNNMRSMIILLFACTCHVSSMLLVPIYLIIWYLNHGGKRISIAMIVILIISLIFITIQINTIYLYAMRLPFFQHYETYDMIQQNEGTGIMQYIYFFPLFLYILQIINSSLKSELCNIFVVFTLVAFVYALLGYKMEVLSRINMSFLGLYTVFVPYFLHIQNNKSIRFKLNIPYSFNLIVWIFIMSVRMYFVFQTNMMVESNTGIYNYNFFSPF